MFYMVLYHSVLCFIFVVVCLCVGVCLFCTVRDVSALCSFLNGRLFLSSGRGPCSVPIVSFSYIELLHNPICSLVTVRLGNPQDMVERVTAYISRHKSVMPISFGQFVAVLFLG